MAQRINAGSAGKSGRPGPARDTSVKVLEADITATRPRGESIYAGALEWSKIRPTASMRRVDFLKMPEGGQ